LILETVFFISMCSPNLNILLTISGAVMGTLVNIWIPVLFYTRAYNGSENNKEKAQSGAEVDKQSN